MSSLQIQKIEIYRIDGGWRDWVFVRISSNFGNHGLSEVTESNGSLAALIASLKDLSSKIVGVDYSNVSEIVQLLRRSVRQSLPGILWKAISGLENALWDLRSKDSELSIAELMGCENQALILASTYWSHCPTTRIRSSEVITQTQIANNSDLERLTLEIKELGFQAIKTNIFNFQHTPIIRMPGFAKNLRDLRSEINVNDLSNFTKSLRLLHSSLPELELIIDLNYNFVESSFKALQDNLEGLPIRWLEVDFDNYVVQEGILNSSKFDICTGENILGLYNFLPTLRDDRVKIVSIDLIWNGLTESIAILKEAVAAGKMIAVHNYYSALANAMALVFYQMIPEENRELLEFDYDDVVWREEIIRNAPIIENGILSHLVASGWGIDLNFEKLEPHIKEYFIVQ
jgi:L-alanine-DL-glutamate epimerase-like enolase superfamily enzyme